MNFDFPEPYDLEVPRRIGEARHLPSRRLASLLSCPLLEISPQPLEFIEGESHS
jgi:hypothetical protein